MKPERENGWKFMQSIHMMKPCSERENGLKLMQFGLSKYEES